jgi:hypothetical protein
VIFCTPANELLISASKLSPSPKNVSAWKRWRSQDRHCAGGVADEAVVSPIVEEHR